MSNRNHRESPAPTSSPGSAPAPDGLLLLVPLFGRACSCGYDDDTTRHGSLASSLFGRARYLQRRALSFALDSSASFSYPRRNITLYVHETMGSCEARTRL